MMPKILNLKEITELLRDTDLLKEIEDGFVKYSQKRVVVPPVGELLFENPPGDVHIKYGYIKEDDYYVIKIASGFYENPSKFGIPSSDGLNLLFSQKSGQLECILLDQGHLTNLRTAAAGAIVAKYLAPQKITAIGICGAGIQGRLQLEYLQKVRPCKNVVVWGITQEEVDRYKHDMELQGFTVTPTLEIEEMMQHCNLIVTCTPATQPYVFTSMVRPGTHITAMGSDTSEKQELDVQILGRADRIIVDSLDQCESRGEAYKAMLAGSITKKQLIELGTMIENPQLHRQSEDEITIADLTGVAVQDIQISKAVYLQSIAAQKK